MDQTQEKTQEPNTIPLKEGVSEAEAIKDDSSDGKSSGPDSKTQDTNEGDSSDLASPEWREAINTFEEVKGEDESDMPLPDKDTEEALKALLESTKRGDHVREAVDPNIKKKPLPQNLKELRVPDGKEDFLCGTMWKRDNSEGLEMIDKGITERQRKILKWLLKSAGRILLEGKSIVNMSLPIIISSKETTLHRAAAQCGYAPEVLTKAGQQKMVTEAFKQLVAYFFMTHHLGISQEKPFNPILGETYEGYLGGVPIYGEQISHHPPISTVFMKTEDFQLMSQFNLEIVLAGPNSARGSQQGRCVVKLPKLNMEVINLPSTATISGTTIGKRYFNWAEKMRVYDPNNNLYAEIQFNSENKGFVGNLFSSKKPEADKVAGKIYQLKPEAMKEFHSKKPTGSTKWAFEPEKHATREICAIEGKWTRYLNIGGKPYWKIEDIKPFQLVDSPNKTLPSDSSYREDLIYRKLNNFEAGQVAKEKMEDAQRADKKLRQGKKGGKH